MFLSTAGIFVEPEIGASSPRTFSSSPRFPADSVATRVVQYCVTVLEAMGAGLGRHPRASINGALLKLESSQGLLPTTLKLKNIK